MNTVHESHPHHKYHKYTYSGILMGSALLLFSVVYYNSLAESSLDPLSIYILLVPGITIILRSLHPPMGFIRLLTVLAGGALIGSVPMLFAHTGDRCRGSESEPLYSAPRCWEAVLRRY